jgi:hypothetical protein
MTEDEARYVRSLAATLAVGSISTDMLMLWHARPETRGNQMKAIAYELEIIRPEVPPCLRLPKAHAFMARALVMALRQRAALEVVEHYECACGEVWRIRARRLISGAAMSCPSCRVLCAPGLKS